MAVWFDVKACWAPARSTEAAVERALLEFGWRPPEPRETAERIHRGPGFVIVATLRDGWAQALREALEPSVDVRVEPHP